MNRRTTAASQRIPGTQVKREIQAHYDDLGQRALKDLAAVQDSLGLWRVVEGDRPALAYFRQRKLQTALALGRFSPGSSLLEVGCGTGDYTLLLARAGFKMSGVDLSPVSIQSAREKARRLQVHDVAFNVSDAELLTEIPDSSVDGVVSFSALRYVPDVERALRAIRRVLKPKGVAVVDFPNKFCPWFTLLKNHFGVETHIHDHQLSTGRIIDLMRQAAFEAITARRILFTTYVLPSSLLPVFKVIDTVGERLPLINQTAGIVMARGARP
jgi:ubiquinone/menaquinone biosynthesis C-methylase UbiE